MKKFAIAALVAASLTSTPGMVVTSANALSCPEDAPAGWKNPGGYCSFIEGTSTGSTLAPTGVENAVPDCVVGVLTLQPGDRARVAGAIDPCHYDPCDAMINLVLELPVGARLALAC